MNNALVIIIIFPLFLAVFSLIIRSVPLLPYICSFFIPILGAFVAMSVYFDGVIEYSIGGWAAPLGITLYADGLSALMILTVSIVLAFLTGYLQSYLKAEKINTKSQKYISSVWLFMWGSLNALFLSRDIFNLYVTLELAGLCSVILIVTAQTENALRAGLRYFILAMLGSLTYLFGVVMVYRSVGVLDLFLISEIADVKNFQIQLGLSFMLLGLFIKGAIFPFHFWLPPAHANALSPVSALLSAIVVKAPFYLCIRIITIPGKNFLDMWTMVPILIFSVCAVFWGSFLALRQNNLKMLIAYSTVAQLGYLYIMLYFIAGYKSISIETYKNAFAGVIYYCISHMVAKAALFMSAGNMIYASDTHRISEIKKYKLFIPVTIFAFGASSVSIMAMPPSGGFIGKWMMLFVSLNSDHWFIFFVLLLGSILSLSYIFRAFKMFFIESDEQLIEVKPIPFIMEFSALSLGIIVLFMGFLSHYPLQLLLNWTLF